MTSLQAAQRSGRGQGGPKSAGQKKQQGMARCWAAVAWGQSGCSKAGAPPAQPVPAVDGVEVVVVEDGLPAKGHDVPIPSKLHVCV